METDDIKQLLNSARETALTDASRRQWRSWSRLQRSLYGEGKQEPDAGTSFWQSWGVTLGALSAIAVALCLTAVMPGMELTAYSTAQARQPNVYSSTFYSSKAQAEVVWITGLEVSNEMEDTP